MGNVEVHCCCCQIKFGSGSPKTPKKKNERSSLLAADTSALSKPNAAMANQFSPNPTIDVGSQFGQNVNDPYGFNQFQQNGIADLRQPPPQQVMQFGNVGYSNPSTVVNHGHSSSYDSFASSGITRGTNNNNNNNINNNQQGLIPNANEQQEQRRSTVADPFSNDDDEDDTTDLDSDYSPNHKSLPNSKRNSTNSINSGVNGIHNRNDSNGNTQMMQDLNNIIENQKKKETIDNNSNNVNNINNINNNNNGSRRDSETHNHLKEIKHSAQNSGNVMSDGIFSTDVDNEENILSATDVDEEDKLLHEQSSDGVNSNAEDGFGGNKEDNKKGVLSGVDESDDNKTGQNEQMTQPPIAGSRGMSKTVGTLPDNTTGSDSDGPSTLLRAQTQSNWTDEKLQDLEDEMRYEFEKLQMMQQQSDMIARATSGSVSSNRQRGPSNTSSINTINTINSMKNVNVMPSLMEQNTNNNNNNNMTTLESMQSQMEAMLNAQEAQMSGGGGGGGGGGITTGVSGGSGLSQADDTTSAHDETEYSDDDEIAQMKAKMKEMAKANQSSAYGNI